MSKDLTAALHALTEQANNQERVIPPPRGAAPAAKSAALMPGGSGGGGAGDLHEENYSAREWHPPVFGSSTDGILWGRVRRIKKVVLKDVNGTVVNHAYANSS